METRTRQTQYSNDGSRLAGYAIVWDSPTTITERGRTFTEVVRRGSINFGDDTISTFNHDPNRLLGRTSSGTLRLHQDEHGVRFEVDLPQSAADIKELVQRGDLKGASFTFRVRPGGERWADSTRELTGVDVYELGPVVAAAYPSTSLGLRSKLTIAKAKLDIASRK
jgi:HK97 family phage prohead protease